MTSISVPGGRSRTQVSPEALSRRRVLLILGITGHAPEPATEREPEPVPAVSGQS